MNDPYVKPLLPEVKEFKDLLKWSTELMRVLDRQFQDFQHLLSSFYHDRGDPAAYDFSLSDLTTGGAWTDLDLSGIVPENTKAVLLRVIIQDDAVGSGVAFRKNGNVYEIVTTFLRTQVADIIREMETIVPCDGDKKIEYYRTDVTFTTIAIAVKGWWK